MRGFHECLSFALGLALSLVSGGAWAARIVAVTSESSTFSFGQRLEAQVELDQVYDNPFDPDEISVDALVVTPSGTVHRLPAFWDRETSRAMMGEREVITAHGEGFFRIRYLPMEEGRHELSIVARDKQSQDVSATIPFDVQPGHERGFVRIDPTDPFALAHDDGTAYVPVGANLGWSVSPAGGYDMEAYLSSLADVGGNWSRLWMTHFGEGWTLEWDAEHPSGYYLGLGRYSPEVASRLDRVFELAESKGIGIQLVLWQHSQFETENWSSWQDNPYNASRGGPADTTEDFFLSPTAIALSQRRLRYLVGRYGAFRSLLAWEIMNEMDGVHAPVKTVEAWCEQRARDLRELDPYRHLVTTSVMVRPSLAPSLVFDSDAYDLSQAHAYGGALWFNVPKDAQALRAHGKPFLFAEFGLDYLGELQNQDPQGLHLSEGSWIALASGYWGGAMSWWWDTYLRPHDLWKTQGGLASFVQSVDLRTMHEPLGEEVTGEAGDIDLDVFGRQGSAGAVLYVRHPDARWELAKDRGLPHVDGARVTVPCSTDVCTVHAFDPSDGTRLREGIRTASQGSLARVSLPAFVGAIALEVRPGAPEAALPASSGGCCRVAHGASKGPAWGALALVALLLLEARRRTRCRTPKTVRVVTTETQRPLRFKGLSG